MAQPDPEPSSPPRRGRPPTLSREDVLGAAVAVMDRDGFDAIAVRSVARELGVNSRALYTYVSGREEMLALVAVRVIGDAFGQLEALEPTREGVLTVLRVVYEVSQQHPDLLPLALYKVPEVWRFQTAPGNAITEYLLGTGLSDQEARLVYRALMKFILGHSLVARAVAEVDAVEFKSNLMRSDPQPFVTLFGDAEQVGGDFDTDLPLLLDKLAPPRERRHAP